MTMCMRTIRVCFVGVLALAWPLSGRAQPPPAVEATIETIALEHVRTDRGKKREPRQNSISALRIYIPMRPDHREALGLARRSSDGWHHPLEEIRQGTLPLD